MAQAGQPRLLPLEELFADPLFSAASLSPDGRLLAYLAPHLGRTNVWVRGVDDEHEHARPVTSDSRRGIKTYYWTDDPRWLLYLQDRDGDEDWHLHRVDVDDPQAPAVDLTPLAPGSRVLSVQVLQTEPGVVLVRMNRRPMHFDVFRVAVATGRTVLHCEALDAAEQLVCSPAGHVFSQRQEDDGSWVLAAVDVDTGERRFLRRIAGPDHPIGLGPVHVTPAGEALVLPEYAGSDDLGLVRLDAATGDLTVLAELPGRSVCTMGSVAATQPPTTFVSRRTGEVVGVRFAGDRPTVVPLDDRFAGVLAALSPLSDGVVGTVSSDRAERLWVVTFLSDTEPGLTWLHDAETGDSRLLFRPYPQLDPAELAPMTAVRFPARDGLPLQAFLTLPRGVEPRALPLVLKVHGGPWTHDSWTFDRDVQLFANRGYAVLQVNFRGSTGLGRRHLLAAVGELAGKMHHDLVDAVDWAIAQGIADPARVGIYGGSYGGYSALVAVTLTPDRFAAAVDYVGISSLPNFMRTLPEWVHPLMRASWYHYGGDPADPAQEADLLARSPITYVDRIRTPLLVAQGANDARVVQAEADNIVGALRARGVPVEYLLAEDEGHGFVNPENVLTLMRAVERHFAAHLGGRAVTADLVDA